MARARVYSTVLWKRGQCRSACCALESSFEMTIAQSRMQWLGNAWRGENMECKARQILIFPVDSLNRVPLDVAVDELWEGRRCTAAGMGTLQWLMCFLCASLV